MSDRSVRVTRGVGENDDLLVISFPVRERDHAALTEAERAVLEWIVIGQGNADIARMRGVSERTIANQVASIFHKLGVCSRLELVALIHSP